MDAWVFWYCSAGATAIAILIAAVEHWRGQVWRRLAERRWRFIEDCSRAARTPEGYCFGPTLIEIQRRERRRLAEENRNWLNCLAAMEERRDYHAARADAAIGQAKRWARVAREQRQTIAEQAELLAGDGARFFDGMPAGEIDAIRKLAMAMAWQKRGGLARLLFHAANMAEWLMRPPATEPEEEPRVSRGPSVARPTEEEMAYD